MSSVIVWNGCLGLGHSAEIPEDMHVETKYVQGNVIKTERSSRDLEHFRAYEESFTLITTEEDARSAFTADAGIDSFVDHTDFSDSYLLIIQNGMQPAMELELDEINRRENGLKVYLSIDGPENPPDTLTTHSFLINITDEGALIPNAVNVEIEGYV